MREASSPCEGPCVDYDKGDDFFYSRAVGASYRDAEAANVSKSEGVIVSPCGIETPSLLSSAFDLRLMANDDVLKEDAKQQNFVDEEVLCACTSSVDNPNR